MKKLFILFFIVIASKGFGQTYSFLYSYSSQGTRCTSETHGWQINMDNRNILSAVTYGAQYPPNIAYQSYTIKLNPVKFDFKLNTGCTTGCVNVLTQTYTLLQLMKAKTVTMWDCNYYQRFAIDAFQPNVNIKNLNTANPNAICAGAQLELAAFPTELLPGNAPDFPAEVYHWVYSLDNKATWIDVPNFIGIQKTNDIATTRFSIQELLPTTHENYLGKTIYFTLAYGAVTAIPILYSPCAPTVDKINYVRPLCYKDNIPSVTVTFSRNLNPQEELRYFQLIAVDPNTNAPDGTPPVTFPYIAEGNPGNGLITKFDEKTTGVYTYSLLNFKGLNPNATYQVKYQAFQDNVTRGVSLSPKAQNLLYKEYEPVKFIIKKADNPICAGAKIQIAIEVTGGTENYIFFVDNNPVTAVKNQTDGYYYIDGIIPTATNNIKVLDTNNCYEKDLTI